MRHSDRDGSDSRAGRHLRALGRRGDAPHLRSGATRVNVPPAIDIAMTAGTTCALTATEGVWCWGRNEFGEAANGGFAISPVPAKASSVPADLVDIEGSCATMLGIRADRTLVSWGDALLLGTGETVPRASAAPVPLPCD